MHICATCIALNMHSGVTHSYMYVIYTSTYINPYAHSAECADCGICTFMWVCVSDFQCTCIQTRT